MIAREESGFTLGEVLVVMLILGLLAAIAIPSLIRQREKAPDANAKAGVRTARTAIEAYATESDGKYVGATAAILRQIEPTLNNVTLVDPTNLSDTTYTVRVDSATGNWFEIRHLATGRSENWCGPPPGGRDGCPNGGRWD